MKGRIFDLGPFPGAIFDEGDTKIECSIIDVTEDELERLDLI